jgi:transposase
VRDSAGRPGHIEFLDSEVEQVERLMSQEAPGSRQVRRLLTVPGVSVICAAVFLAAVGDIRRFNGSRPVVAYIGLDRASTSQAQAR